MVTDVKDEYTSFSSNDNSGISDSEDGNTTAVLPGLEAYCDL